MPRLRGHGRGFQARGTVGRQACFERDRRGTGSGAAKYLRDDLNERWLIWGGDAAEDNFLSGLVQIADVIKIDTVTYLRAAEGEIKQMGWSGIVPPDFENLTLPPVVVRPDASQMFKLAMAIGLALPRSPGAPQLCLRDFAANTDATATYITKATGSTTMFRCRREDCTFYRPYRLWNHYCEDEDGDGFPPEKRRKVDAVIPDYKNKRQCTIMNPVGSITFHALPPRVKSWAWALFCSASNPLDVTCGFFAPNPGSLPALPVHAPSFGPADVQRLSNSASPSDRKTKRKAKADKAGGTGSTPSSARPSSAGPSSAQFSSSTSATTSAAARASSATGTVSGGSSAGGGSDFAGGSGLASRSSARGGATRGGATKGGVTRGGSTRGGPSGRGGKGKGKAKQ